MLIILIISVVSAFCYERREVIRRHHDAATTQGSKRAPAAALPPNSPSAPKIAQAPAAKNSSAANGTHSVPNSSSKKSDLISQRELQNAATSPEIWQTPEKLGRDATPKISEVFPEAKDLPLPHLLSQLAVTDFKASGPVVYEGVDENYHEYDQNGPNGEQVQKYFSPEGHIAIEQINYSPEEQIVKRYDGQSSTLAEVSYEYKNQGGVLRFLPDGTVESFHTWDTQNNQILTRYNPAGQATEVWHWTPESEWKQIR